MQIDPPVAAIESYGERPTNEYRDCPKAHFETTEDIDQCPRCGGPLQREVQIRAGGDLMMVLGGFMSGVLALVFLGVFFLFLFVPRRQDFAVNVIFLGIILWIFSLLSFFVGITFSGRRQSQTGRRQKGMNKRLIWLLTGGILLMTILLPFTGC